MTLVRTAIRLLTVACLAGTETARPTLAEGRVYDSLADPLDPATLEQARPVLIVLTDQDKGEALSRGQNGGPPFARDIDLVIEAAMVGREQLGDGAFAIGYPQTDAELEASLDFLEFQAWRRLAYDPDPLCVLWRRLARPMSTEGHRQVSSEAGVRLAARQWTWTVRAADDQVEIVTGATAPAGFDLLPRPLRDVALALPPGSPGRLSCEAIVARLSPPLTAGPLLGIDVKLASSERGVDSSERIRARIPLRRPT